MVVNLEKDPPTAESAPEEDAGTDSEQPDSKLRMVLVGLLTILLLVGLAPMWLPERNLPDDATILYSDHNHRTDDWITVTKDTVTWTHAGGVQTDDGRNVTTSRPVTEAQWQKVKDAYYAMVAGYTKPWWVTILAGVIDRAGCEPTSSDQLIVLQDDQAIFEATKQTCKDVGEDEFYGLAKTLRGEFAQEQ